MPKASALGTFSNHEREYSTLNTRDAKLGVFFLASDLGPTGPARQLGLLAAGLCRNRFEAKVGVVGPANSPVAADLCRAGIPVYPLPVRHLIDVRGIRKLRQTVTAANPAVIHAWGPQACRATRLFKPTVGGGGPQLVVSAATRSEGGFYDWLTARRLRCADRVIPSSWADGERYRRLGVAADRLTRISPAAPPAPPPPPRETFLLELGLPSTARLVMAADRLESSAGLQAAVWAFDMLRYDFPDLYLLIFGSGPDRAGIEAFGRALAFDDFRIRFPGCRPDLPALLGLAEVVWVTRARGGVTLALEAMAASRPVIGWKTPDLSEVVEDGVTGFLVDPKERPLVSARTHRLLCDPDLGNALGAAGRARVAEGFGVDRMIERFSRVYEDLVESCSL